MLKAYVGIARPDGLVCFLPDLDEWTRLIEKQPASFRTVLAEDVAQQVQRELQAGERFRAMQILDALASEIEALKLA